MRNNERFRLEGTALEANVLRLLIVDDHEMFLQGLAQLLSKKQNIDIIGFATTAMEAEKSILCKKPEVTIIDIGLPDKSALEVI